MGYRGYLLFTACLLLTPALAQTPTPAPAPPAPPIYPVPFRATPGAPGGPCLPNVQPPGRTAGVEAPTPPCQVEGQPIETRTPELGLGGPSFPEQTRAPYRASKTKFKVTVIAEKLDRPWALQFLPSGKFLVTEKVGAMRIISRDGTVSAPLKNLPAVSYNGDAGLMDVALDPHFAENHTIYFNYDRTEQGGVVTRVALAKAVLDEDNLALNNVRVIWHVNEVRTKLPSNLANGRILFDKDGTIFFSAGSRGINPQPRDSAQDPLSTLGKIVHITTEGAAVSSNPFYGKVGFMPEIWALGFRTPEGLTFDNKGQMWEAEHGPRGGDEINLVKKGANYGWAVVSHGIDYSGEVLGGGNTQITGMEEPRYYFNPSMGPGCLRFYHGAMFPEWEGHAFLCQLRGRALDHLVIDRNNKVISEEPLLTEMHAPIRDMRVAADGSMYVLQDGDKIAKLLRISAD